MTWGLCVVNIFPALPQTNRRLTIASSFLPWHVPPSIFMTFSMPSLCIGHLSFICRDVDNGADIRAEPGRPCLWDSCLHTGRAAAAGCHFQRPPGTPSPAMTWTNAFTRRRNSPRRCFSSLQPVTASRTPCCGASRKVSSYRKWAGCLFFFAATTWH